jgi:SlyX protein
MANVETLSDGDRLRALEERLTFQQRAVEDLNEVVLRHERRIEELTRELAMYAATLERVSQQTAGELPHEKPPHY